MLDLPSRAELKCFTSWDKMLEGDFLKPAIGRD